MAETITLPQLGMNMREGTFLNWTKQIGDKVTAGDAIAEIESDKATIEVPAPNGGVLLQTLVNVGDVVQVGAPIAVVGASGEAVSAPPMQSAPPPASAPTAQAPVPAAAPVIAAPPAPAPVPTSPEDESLPGGLRATPLARKMAEERHIELRNIAGTGPNGRITKADIEAYIPSAGPMAVTPAAPLAPVPAVAARTPNPVPVGPDFEEIPLSRMRARIGNRMTESKQTVPHFYVTVSVDMAAAMALRKQINESLDDAHKVSVNDLVVKAAALTLRQYPNLNTHFYGDRLIHHKRVNIGIAVAMDGGGLINVVAKDADRTPISQMAAKNKEMIASARTGKVKPDDIENSTFTISNLGPYDVEMFTAIINPPEAGIIAVGTVQQVPVVIDGTIAIGTRMNCTLSADHRVSDGAEGAQFMQSFKKLLESPMRLLI